MNDEPKNEQPPPQEPPLSAQTLAEMKAGREALARHARAGRPIEEPALPPDPEDEGPSEAELDAVLDEKPVKKKR